MASSVIKEGFICADCHAQFTNPNALLNHYQTQHEQEEFNIKGLIEKAKNKLTISSNSGSRGGPNTYSGGGGSGGGFGSSSNEESSILLRAPPRYFDVYTDNIDDGKIYSHFESFKRIRMVQVEKYSSDANRILIRLQKLLSVDCEDNSKRKAHEQDIVPWIEEKFVSRCPDCAQSFGLLLRKHHCRLCGSILCEHCSEYITQEFGESIVKSQMGVTIKRERELRVPDSPRLESQAAELITRGFTMFNNNSNSNGNKNGGDPNHPTNAYKVRCCSYCYRLVAKKQLLGGGQAKAIITQFYDKLKALQRECEILNLEYIRMITSLMDGETLFSVELATKFRNDIIKNTEKIDTLSKKILVLGTESNDLVISETEKRLRSRIRTNSVNWIRDFLSGLRVIPEKPGTGENSTAGEANNKPPVVKFVDGWTSSPPDSSAIDDTTDVMEIQIRNMRKWIDEARAAKKLDEVTILEANLADLLKLHYQQSL